MENQNIKVGITQGDINGIGYEIILKTLMDARLIEMCSPIVYGSPKVVAYHKKALNIANFNFQNIKSPDEANQRKPYLINVLDDNIKVEFGQATPMSGEAAVVSLRKAVEDLKNNKIDVLITAPFNKFNIQSKDFNFPGHTEYLANAFNVKEHLMLMISDSMKIGVVSGHMPISKVSEFITRDKIVDKLRIIHKSLLKDFNIRQPKIAVLGLNPHAGDNGLLGNEEKDIIIPAIEKAKDEKIAAFGPYPADGFFGSNQFTKFDAILAMYHDQGLTPFKALSFDSGINYTAGLPVIRTSPGHGTGYDIAGKGTASENSFRQALFCAIDIHRNRKLYAEISKNPLQVQTIRSNDVIA